MGAFDRIDKQYRTKQPIKLECQRCAEPKPDVTHRYGSWFVADMNILCDVCVLAVRREWLDGQYKLHYPDTTINRG